MTPSHSTPSRPRELRSASLSVAATIGLLTALLPASARADAGADAYLQTLQSLMRPDPKPISVGVPSGFGAAKGLAFASVAYTDQDRNTGEADDNDGSIALGIGLGDPSTGLAFEAVIGITSVSTTFWGDGAFADEGNLSVKLHRTLPGLAGARVASLAIGIGNIAGWGSTQDLPKNLYVSYSQVSDVALLGDVLPVNATVGYGSAVSGVDRDPGGFASVGIGLTSSLSMGLGWMGDEVQLGAVYFPQGLPSWMPETTIALTYADATHRHSENGRLILSINVATNLWGK